MNIAPFIVQMVPLDEHGQVERAHEPWAILCRHPPVPEVPQHSVTPCLVNGARNVVSGRELPAPGTDRTGLIGSTADFARQCGDSAEVLAIAPPCDHGVNN